MEINYEKDGRELTVTLSFDENSNTNTHVNSRFVFNKITEEGYKATKFLKSDLIKDKKGRKTSGVWKFMLAEEEKGRQELLSIDGIGERTADKLLQKFGDILEIKKSVLEGDIDNFTGMTDKAENNMRVYFNKLEDE